MIYFWWNKTYLMLAEAHCKPKLYRLVRITNSEKKISATIFIVQKISKLLFLTYKFSEFQFPIKKNCPRDDSDFIFFISNLALIINLEISEITDLKSRCELYRSRWVTKSTTQTFWGFMHAMRWFSEPLDFLNPKATHCFKTQFVFCRFTF